MGDRLENYTIGWVCALEIEVVPAVLCLDEEIEDGPDVPGGDTEQYRFGKIGEHYVVIAVPASGDKGEVSAANTALNMTRTFTNVRIALLVGIGGGAPRRSFDPNCIESRDICLGDIVVGIPDKEHSGVWQYDFGALYTKEIGFVTRNPLNKPPPFIRKVVTDLELDRKVKKQYRGQWKLYEEGKELLADQYDELVEQYQRPDLETDLLFPSNFSHGNQQVECLHVNSRCLERISEARRRPLRTRKENGVEVESMDPVVHLGLIGTGNTVMKRADRRDKLARAHDVLCFEMEAAGLVNTMPCLVIRGISDYSDDHKSNRWQGYAALIAALYARRVLRKLRAKIVVAEQPISQKLANIETEMKKTRTEAEKTRFAIEEADRKADEKRLQELLPYADDAAFNSYRSQSAPTCLRHTRVEVLREIKDWVEGNSEEVIFWINGMAGMGKSTIARTIAHNYNSQNKLLSSFFFYRSEGSASSGAEKFVSTIALDLARNCETAKKSILRTLNNNSSIAKRSLSEQWKHLILQPLLELPPEPDSIEPLLLLVIDALDECESESDIRTILSLLSNKDFTRITATRLRVLVTSRQETPIRLGFYNMPRIHHKEFVLETISPTVVDSDITRYFEAQFQEIRGVPEFSLPPRWPGENAIKRLVKVSEGLFIYASTLCRFLKCEDGHSVPRKRLEELEAESTNSFSAGGSGSVSRGNRAIRALYRMYEQILQHAIRLHVDDDVYDDPQENAERAESYGRMIHQLMALFEPISLGSFCRLLSLPLDETRSKFLRLRSVFNVPQDSERDPIRILHTSFRDFLLNSTCCPEPFFLGEEATHGLMAKRCIDLMSKKLKKNICSYQSESEDLEDMLSKLDIDKIITPDLSYACRYWVLHLERGGSTVDLSENGPVNNFLRVHLLHWMEVLVLIKRSHEGIADIRSLGRMIKSEESPLLSEFIRDAKCFAIAHKDIYVFFPLQLYGGALLFSPEDSPVRRQFQVSGDITEKVQLLTTNEAISWEADYGSEIHTLYGEDEKLGLTDFSPLLQVCVAPDGERLVAIYGEDFDPSYSSAGSSLGTIFIKIWSLKTGRCLLSLQCELTHPLEDMGSNPVALAIPAGDSSNTFTVATVYEAHAWDLDTGILRWSKEFLSVQSKHWELAEQEFAKEKVRTNLAIAPNGLWLALQVKLEFVELEASSASSSSTSSTTDPEDSQHFRIQIWSLSSGELVSYTSVLVEDGQTIRCLSFSPDSTQLFYLQTLIYLEAKGTVHVGTSRCRRNCLVWWASCDVIEGSKTDQSRLLKSMPIAIGIEGSFIPCYMSIAHDGQTIALGYTDGKVEIWEVSTGKDVHKPLFIYRPSIIGVGERWAYWNHVRCIQYSPVDGRRIAVKWEGGKLELLSLESTEPLFSINTKITDAPSCHRHYSFEDMIIQFAPDGKTMVSTSKLSYSNRIQVWDVSSHIHYPNSSLSELLLRGEQLPGGRSTLSDSGKGLHSPKPSTKNIHGGSSKVVHISIAPDCDRVVTISDNGVAVLWIAGGKQPDQHSSSCGQNQTHANPLFHPFRHPSSDYSDSLGCIVSVAAFSPDGQTLAFGFSGRARSAEELELQVDSCRSTERKPGGIVLYTWDTTNSTSTIAGTLHPLHGILPLACTGCPIFDAASGTTAFSRIHLMEVAALAFSPKSTLSSNSPALLASHEKCTFSDFKTGQEYIAKEAHAVIILWNTTTKERIRRLYFHFDPFPKSATGIVADWIRNSSRNPSRLLFSSDGKRLFWGSSFFGPPADRYTGNAYSGQHFHQIIDIENGESLWFQSLVDDEADRELHISHFLSHDFTLVARPSTSTTTGRAGAANKENLRDNPSRTFEVMRLGHNSPQHSDIRQMRLKPSKGMRYLYSSEPLAPGETPVVWRSIRETIFTPNTRIASVCPRETVGNTSSISSWVGDAHHETVWGFFGDDNVLTLPTVEAYRLNEYRYASNGNMLVIGSPEGNVHILRFT